MLHGKLKIIRKLSANFEKYLKAVNYADKAYIYNTAVAATNQKIMLQQKNILKWR